MTTSATPAMTDAAMPMGSGGAAPMRPARETANGDPALLEASEQPSSDVAGGAGEKDTTGGLHSDYLGFQRTAGRRFRAEVTSCPYFVKLLDVQS